MKSNTEGNFIRSISQVEAHTFLVEFFENNNNQPVRYADLAQALMEKFQANSNQIAGLVNRGHANIKEKVLIKKCTEYSLNMDSCNKSSIVDYAKLEILKLFKELKDTLKTLNELSQ